MPLGLMFGILLAERMLKRAGRRIPRKGPLPEY
jgi:hypothetical protein